MARLATLNDFHAQYDAEGLKIPGTGLLYDDYRRYDHFAQRATLIASRWPVSVGKVVVFGAGYGYLVDELFNRGYDAWGVEAADYARNKAVEVLPAATSGRIRLANVVNRSALNTVRADAGLSGQQRFGLGISEDVLPMAANDAEALLALDECRRIISTTAGRFLHIITPAGPNDAYVADPAASADAWQESFPGERPPTFRLVGLNWQTIGQWRALIGPTDPILDTQTGVVTP